MIFFSSTSDRHKSGTSLDPRCVRSWPFFRPLKTRFSESIKYRAPVARLVEDRAAMREFVS